MGSGSNYIREIMQMNLPEESTPKPLREYESEAKRRLNERFGVPKKFHYIGLTPYMPFENNRRVKLMPTGMAGVIACTKDELTVCDASVNDVVQFCGRLYTFTDQKRWVQFVPGPCTDYDGPNPYEKRVMVSTAPSIDSPLAEMIREKTNILMDQLGIGYDAPSAIEKHGDMVTFNYNIKYIGETVTDIVNKPKKRSIDIRHIDPYVRVHFALIGDVVTYKGGEYIYTGENDGWEVFDMKFQPNNKEEKNMAIKNVFDEKELCLTYIGKTTTRIWENSTAAILYVEGTWISSKLGYMVMYDGRLYVCAPDGKWHDLTATNVKTASTAPINYSKIPYGYLFIKKVHYSGDKTIVMWEDGTKTIVTKGENEDFDPEKGLVMAIAKKAFGNQGNYYNQIKKWLPEPIPAGTDMDTLQSPGVYYTKQTEDLFRETKDAIQDLIVDMTYNGATKAELVRAIKYSKEYIDWLKAPADENTVLIKLEKLKEKYGIEELKEKYHKA